MIQPSPNVVLVIMDDLAWGDLACHGNPVTHTPNLDRLYAESSHLTRYCSGPLCSPARASLMTGRYHLRTRVLDTYGGRSTAVEQPEQVAACVHCTMRGMRHRGDMCKLTRRNFPLMHSNFHMEK